MLSSSGRYEPFRSAIIARASETEVPPLEGFDLVQSGAYDEPFRGSRASTWRSVVMVVKRRGIALSVTSVTSMISAAVVLACSVALVAQKKDDKKQTDAQKKEILDIVKIVDAAA